MRPYNNKETFPGYRPRRHHPTGGFTLIEVVTSIFIVALVFGGILAAYIQGARRAEWSGYSLAAQAVGLREIERGRAIMLDVRQNQISSQLWKTNLLLLDFKATSSAGGITVSGYTTNILDLPYSGGNFVLVTNLVSIQTVTVKPGVQVQFMQVDTVWPFAKGQAVRYFTNSIGTYFAPDNRLPAS